MLSEKTFEAIGRILGHFCFLKIIPCDWNSKGFTLTVIKDSRLFISLGIYMSIWAHTVYLTYFQLTRSMLITERVIHFGWQVAYVLASVSAYNNFTRRNQIAAFINHFFKLDKSLKGKKILKILVFFNCI